MKIIAGQWRGRPLAIPQSAPVRPTAARVREAMFSMLLSRIGTFEGLEILDLFAGSGALGFEALSRGAQHCFFIEKNPQAVQCITGNVARLHANATCWTRDATRIGVAPRPMHILFLDPPYDQQDQLYAALDSALAGGWVAPGAWVCAETARDLTFAPPAALHLPTALHLDVTRDHGAARIHLLHHSPI